MDLRNLTDEELLRYCLSLNELTVLENELLRRLEILLDEVTALEEQYGGDA